MSTILNNDVSREVAKIVLKAKYPNLSILERGDYTIGKALCGAKPGPRSGGWTCRTDLAVSCPRCIKKMQAT